MILILYTKYSLNSKKLMDLLDKFPIDFKINFQPICVDNKKVRNIILSSKKIKVNLIPCLLIIYPNGGVEQYDGETAYIWLLTLLEKIIPENKQETTRENIREIKQETIQENKQEKVVESILKQNDNIENKKVNKKVNFKKGTSISEILNESDSQNNDTDDTIDIFDDIIETNKKSVKTDKSDNKNEKNSNLMAAAMEMQKLREREAEMEKQQMPTIASR